MKFTVILSILVYIIFVAVYIFRKISMRENVRLINRVDKPVIYFIISYSKNSSNSYRIESAYRRIIHHTVISSSRNAILSI